MSTREVTIHTTACGRYVISGPKAGSENIVCRSLHEAYGILRRKRIGKAQLAQRVAFDEMIGLPAEQNLSYQSLPVPFA